MNNLKLLRKSKKLTLKQIGNELQISSSTYSQWENEKREPSINMLIKIADFFKVSIDFILCRQEVESDSVDSIYRNNDFNINKDRILSLIKQISTFDDKSFSLLQGYIQGLIANKNKSSL